MAELGEASFGILKLGETSYGTVKLVVLGGPSLETVISMKY